MFFTQLLRLDAPLRLASAATLAALLYYPQTSFAQTSSTCNPVEGSSCAADTALGASKSYNFASGASNDFTASGSPTYDSNGVSFTVSSSGDSPLLTSKWYIMFGSYTVSMKAAPGAGIVSSVVLQSDDLDEIDWEWLGAQNNEVQSNYFGQGKTDQSGRSANLAVSDTQDDFHEYTIQWSSAQIVWQIDGKTVRVLEYAGANGEYPQTPMQLKIGAWSGGDSSNPQGTIQWAQGPTNYANGPFTMVVKSLSVQDYSTGTSYSYSGSSGSWQSIKSNGGTINSSGGSNTNEAAPVITSTSSGDTPFEGTHRSSSSVTSVPGIGDWQISTLTTATATALSSSGRVVSASGATVSTSRM